MTDEGYVPSKRPELFDDAEADPYEAEDLESYPAWWRDNIREFNEYGLRPYRPPRFADGELTTETIGSLEAALGITIRLRSVNPRIGDEWAIVVDGEPVARVGRHRDGDGYTVYELPAQEFEALVRDAVD